MMLGYEPFQAFFEYVRVDLSGRDVGMSEQALHRSEVGAPVQQMAGEGVPEHMRRDALGIEPGPDRAFLEVLGEPLPREMAGVSA
jgi:hypothetical protein